MVKDNSCLVTSQLLLLTSDTFCTSV